MKIVLVAATLLAGTMPAAPASAGHQSVLCTAKVLHSEELPFAPMYHWLARVTLEITPPKRGAFEAVLQYKKSWQEPPARRGQTFRVRCDPDHPSDLQTIYRPVARRTL
jgi:hypothetical protein